MKFYNVSYTIFTILTAGSLLLFPTKLNPCAPDWEWQEYDSFTFPARIQASPDRSFLFLDFGQLYEELGGQQGMQRGANIREWRERFCDRARMEDVEFFVYQTTVRDLEQVRTAIRSAEIPLPPSLQSNTFARQLDRSSCTEAVDYLIYAKQCEPHVTLDPERRWYKPRIDELVYQRDGIAMRELREVGKLAFAQTKSHYFKLRYLYQLVRLAHYAGRYQEALDLYDELYPQIDHDPSEMVYWIMGHRAGAMMKLGRRAEAAYLYSRVFAQSPGKRASAHLSFSIRAEEEWEECMLLCRNKEEQAALYAIRGFNRKAKVTEEMESIYELDPGSPMLELLLVREIIALEPLLNREHPRRYYADSYLNLLGKRAIALEEFCRRSAREGKVARPSLWRSAQAYLEALSGDYYAAVKTIDLALEQTKDKKIREQLEIWALVVKILAWETPDEATEQEAYRIQSSDRWYEDYQDRFSELLYGRLALLYQQAGRPGKAYLCQYDIRDLRANPQEEIVDDLFRLVRKEEPNRFERLLMKRARTDQLEDDLLELQSMAYWRDGQLEAAIELFKEIDRTRWDDYGRFNPYIERMVDCVFCPPADTLRDYNKGELLQSMLRLEYKGKADPEAGARYFYQLGIAWYNMTYFGYAWEVLDHFRSGASATTFPLHGQVYYTGSFPNGNMEFMDMERARNYFELTRELSDDPELQARATYWVAKCDRNEYYATKHLDSTRSYEAFDLLEARYTPTQYYQRAVNTCQTLEAYTQQ